MDELKMGAFNELEEGYIFLNYKTLTDSEIAAFLGRKRTSIKNFRNRNNLQKPEDYATPTNFQKGQTPWNKGKKGYMGANKTSFPKGLLPHNTRHDGAISIRQKKNDPPYVYERIGLSKWVLQHRLNWIRKNGAIPAGQILRCKTNDTLNTDPDNWYLIDRAKHARLNHNSEKATANGPFVNLSDRYVATMATMKEPELKEDVLKNPDLIELIRTKMKLQRELKNGSKESERPAGHDERPRVVTHG